MALMLIQVHMRSVACALQCALCHCERTDPVPGPVETLFSTVVGTPTLTINSNYFSLMQNKISKCTFLLLVLVYVESNKTTNVCSFLVLHSSLIE